MASDSPLLKKTSRDSANIINMFKGSPAEFFAESILNSPIGPVDVVHPDFSATEFAFFHGVEVRIDFIIVNKMPKITVKQISYSAYHRYDTRFDNMLADENASIGIDPEDDGFHEDRLYELPPCRTDRKIKQCRFIRTYMDTTPLIKVFPKLLAPGKYDFRGALVDIYNQLSRPDVMCLVPGCGRLCMKQQQGGFCDLCVRIVNERCEVCGHSFGFQVPGTKKHTFCQYVRK